MLPVVILAGGLGTRLRGVTRDVLPKALVQVDGRPFIDFKLDALGRDGVEQVLLLVGRHADQIEAHVGDGSRFGLRVQYRRDGDELLGTGGAVRAAVASLPDEFWVTYGDTLLKVDLVAAEAQFRKNRWLGLMTVLENRDRWEPSNVRVEHGLVVSYCKNPPLGTHAFIDYGMLLLTSGAFDRFPEGRAFELGSVFEQLISSRTLGSFVVTERFYDIGTLERLAETEQHLRVSGMES